MTVSKPWAAKGVALYPPSFSMVGQNQVFNALHQFRRSFWDGAANDIAGFFVAFGDWGLGKTRLGYELIAEATGRVDRWLLNKNEYIIPPFHQSDKKPRVLEPALREGVLPLYIRYSTICDDALDAATWVARLSVEALRHTLHADPAAGGPRDLYEDLKAAMVAKGVNLKALSLLDDDTRSFEDRLTDAKKVLRDAGLNHLWIIVDEVETPGDLKRGLREDTQTRVDDEYLLMVSEVIKHENWRNLHPDVNFLLLCSVGMRDQIHIGPNLRRASSVTIEPNQLTDAQSYVDHIKDSLADPDSVEYPMGTLEGAFLSANRNFGWLNVIMASIHETHARHLERGDGSSAWELLKDFAKTDARASHIFNDGAVLPLLGTVTGVPKQEVERLVYGQLPAPVGGVAKSALTKTMADALLAHEVAGRGHAFAELFQVHIDERALANELTRPEFGFKAKEGKTDTYFTPNCEVSVVGLLEALRAFSVAVGGVPGAAGDFVVYADLEQWGEQLAALYPREGIEFAAESLHRIFSRPEYRVDGTRFVGMSFRLWREFNKLLVSAAESVRFFKDGRHEASLDQYVRGVSPTKAKRGTAICLGLAKLLDDHLDDAGTKQVAGLKDVPHMAFTSMFGSPSLDGLRVTPDGRCTIVYCLDIQETLDKLRAYIGLEHVHPIVVLFPATAEVASFEQQLDASPVLRRCVLTRRMVSQEEEFLLNYSGRGSAYNPHEARLSKVAKGLEGSYRDEWQGKTRDWANGLRKMGYLLAPIWSRKAVNNTADFAKGYRYMLAKDCSLDAAIDTAGGPLNNVEFESCRQAAKKNIDAPATWKYGDLLGVLTTDGSLRPKVPRCFFALLQELRTQSAVSKLANTFFFAVPDTEMKAPQQLEQILEVLIGVGLVRKRNDLYKAVDKTMLESPRQSASTWLEGECKDSIKKLTELFPTQAGILLNNSYPAAKQQLLTAEKHIQQVSSDHLTADIEGLTEESLKTVVAQALEIEQHILGVCPLGIGGATLDFDCSPARILSYENRYTDMSLWDRVAFLAWLKKKFLEARDEMIEEIDHLLTEAATLDKAEGHPFPVAPVTLPLKAIKSELENAVKGPAAAGSQTRMATIPVASYTLMIDQYLVNSQYEQAWKRMDALKDLISKERPSSFFGSFKRLHEQWAKAVKDFKSAASAWQLLADFAADAPASVQPSLSPLKLEVHKFRGLVEGGLEQQIQSQIDQVPETELMKCLETEVVATAHAVQGLPQRVTAKFDELKLGLREVIRQRELRALNRVLKSNGKPDKSDPTPAATFGATKTLYEAFNGQVSQEGASYFENAGKIVHFSLWVDISSELEAGTYDEGQHPDHAVAIGELKELKLIRSKLELR
ncbi:hypothetical protein [Burkholderia sp. Ac-20349]|uniref:hypothetical protein n=1 Tax=Burkholderia sp. Ac-20349 TaxID=2703893 RepID=UPI00197C37E0|nr:hypothetical protein [Burkholderia sp. Ac-20349]MBN3840987.1 hypothetical protein [Burkholderia sp. Ac-20349]